jgi:hypothetical protein
MSSLFLRYSGKFMHLIVLHSPSCIDEDHIELVFLGCQLHKQDGKGNESKVTIPYAMASFAIPAASFP